MRPTSFRFLVFASLVLCAGLVSAVVSTSGGGGASPTEIPRIGREEILRASWTERAALARTTADAAARIDRARALARTNPTAASVILNEVLRRPLPRDPLSDKTWADGAVLLGDLYAAAGPRSYAKALRYYAQASARLASAELEARSEIASRFERLAHALDEGGGLPVGEAFPGESSLGDARPENDGANTCDQAIPVGVVPPDYLEPGMLLAEEDEDWRSFEITSARSILIETVGDPLQCDTNLLLFGGCESGAPTDPLFFNEDRSRTDYTSSIPNDGGGLCLAPGTYYVDIGSFLYLGTVAPFDFRIRDLGPCTVPVPDAYEPDDALDQARRIRVRRDRAHDHDGSGSSTRRRGVQQHSVFPRGDIDFVRFALPHAEMIRVHAGSEDGRADTFLGVGYRDGGVLVGVNDDEGPGSKGSAFAACMPAGDYFAVALSTYLPFVFDYDLEVESTGRCVFEQEPNGSIGSANPLKLRRGTATIHGVHTNLPGVEDFDTFRFRVPARRGVVIEASGYDTLDVDTYLELYDAGGSRLATDEDGGVGFLSRIERVLPAGTYYARLTQSGFELPAGDTWFYSLKVTLSEPPLVEVEPNDACGQAVQGVTLGSRLLGSIGPSVGDRDHYLLSVGPSSLGGVQVEIQTTSVGDTVLKLYDDPGACLSQIGCDDDSAAGLDSLITCCIQADASYVVQVSDFANNSTLESYAIEFRRLGECIFGGACPIAPGQLGCP